jgi:hypothetical protein
MLGIADRYETWSGASESLPAGHQLGAPVLLVRKLEPTEFGGEP